MRELSARAGGREYQVFAALMNLTGAPQPSGFATHLPGRPDVELRLGVVVRTMREEDAGGTLLAIEAGAIGSCVLPWVPLMRDSDEPAMIEKWKEVGSREPNEVWRVHFKRLALVFADLGNRSEVWQRGLEGWQVNESKVANQWREEGVTLGELRARRQDILDLLQHRFSAAVPPDVSTTVGSISESQVLSRLVIAAGTVESLDAFREVLKQGPPSPK